MKNSRVWSATHTVVQNGAAVDRELGRLLAPSLDEALSQARKFWPRANRPIKVKIVRNAVLREDSIAEARRLGTLYEVAKKGDLDLAKLYDADVVLVGGLVVKNRFGRIERDLLRL